MLFAAGFRVIAPGMSENILQWLDPTEEVNVAE